MADKKISALTASSTPLAGTEVLPIVQSSATVKVAVSDLTAGRAVSAASLTLTTPLAVANGGTGVTTSTGTGNTVLSAAPTLSGNVTLSTGNLIPGTAAKGVNFTANTPAAGMTSQLLNWYEEGTFTPTIASDAGSVSLSTAVGKYTRIGRQVTINANVTVSASTASSNVYLASLPFTPSSNGSGSIYAYSFSSDAGTPMVSFDSGSATAGIQRVNGTGSVATLGPRLQAGTVMYFSLTYFV